jgi:hypothetical protein
VVLYGCESLSLTLREEHRLKVFDSRVLRRIFGPKSGEVIGGWRKLHNEELRNLYSSQSITTMIKSKRMTWARHVARMGKARNGYRILVGKPEGKRPLGRPRRSCEDNIETDLSEIGWGGMDWIDLAQDGTVEGSCEHGNEPLGEIKCWEILEYLSDYWVLKKASALCN